MISAKAVRQLKNESNLVEKALRDQLNHPWTNLCTYYWAKLKNKSIRGYHFQKVWRKRRA